MKKQVELLFENGNHLLSRIFMFYSVHLYAYSGFYAEIWYRQADNRIDRVVMLESETVLDLYSGQIDLSDLNKTIGL